MASESRLRRPLAVVMVLAVSCWVVSDVLELLHGGHGALSLWLTVVYHVLAAGGVFGLHLTHAAAGPARTSLVGTALLSIGYLALCAVPALLLLGGAYETPQDVMAVYPVLKAFGFASAVGIVTFGVAVVRARRFPVWTAIVFVVGSFVTLAAIATGAPPELAIGANFAVSAALLRMAWPAWRSP